MLSHVEAKGKAASAGLMVNTLTGLGIPDIVRETICYVVGRAVGTDMNDWSIPDWFEPELALEKNKGFSGSELQIIETIIKEREDEIRSAWQEHFKA